jgi:acyl carrier protein
MNSAQFEGGNLTYRACEVGGAKVDVDEQCASGRGTSEVELSTQVAVRYRRMMTIVPCQAIGGVEMQYVSTSVQDRVLFVVRSVLKQNSIIADVHPESRLVDMGLDSMDMVALMLKVEAEFDLTLPQPEITPENFQSVKTLELMIRNQLGSGAG